MNLTHEQAQAVADVVLACDDDFYYSDMVEALYERFPLVRWKSLIWPWYADPRPAIPRPPLTREQAEAQHREVTESLNAYVTEMQRALDEPTRLVLPPPA